MCVCIVCVWVCVCVCVCVCMSIIMSISRPLNMHHIYLARRCGEVLVGQYSDTAMFSTLTL